MAARCGLPTFDFDLSYREECTDALDHIVGSEGHDFLQQCVELVEGACRDGDHSDKRRWKYILRVMMVLRNLHRASLCKPRTPPPLSNDIQSRNNNERPRERSRSPTTWRICPHEPPSSATATSFTCDDCGDVKNIKKDAVVPEMELNGFAQIAKSPLKKLSMTTSTTSLASSATISS